MGAYENPNINIGVDTESNQLINRAFASFGQSIAQGVEGANKIALQQREKEEKNRVEALQRAIGIIDDLGDASIKAGENQFQGNDLSSAVNGAAFNAITEVGDNGEVIGTTSAMSQVLEATQTGTATSDQILKNNQWKRFIPHTKTVVENVTAAGNYVNNLKVGQIYMPGSSSRLLSFLNGEFTDADTNVIYNKKNGFSYLTKAEGGVIANIGDGKYELNWNEANAGIVKSMNDADLYHIGVGKDDIITIPPLQELSYETFVGNPAKGEGAIIKPNSYGTARFYNQALYVEEEIITGVDDDGTYTQVIKKPNVENLQALALETGGARIDSHLMTGPNSYKSLNAYFDNYFNPPVGPGHGFSIEEMVDSYSDLKFGQHEFDSKKEMIAHFKKIGILGGISDETGESGEDPRSWKDVGGSRTFIFKLKPSEISGGEMDQYLTELPGNIFMQTYDIDAMKKVMTNINNKILGTYEKPDDATATPKDRTYKKFPQNITTDDKVAARFKNLNLIYNKGKTTPDGPNKFVSGGDPTNYGYENGVATGGAGELLQELKKSGTYHTSVLNNFIPMHDGSPFQTSLKSDTRKAVIASMADEFDGNKFFPYSKLEAAARRNEPVVVKGKITRYNITDKGEDGDALLLKRKIMVDADVQRKIQNGQYQKNMNKGMVYDKKTGAIIGSSELLDLISRMDPNPIKPLKD